METDSVVKSKKKDSSKRPKVVKKKTKADKIKIEENLSRTKRRNNKYRRNRKKAMIYISRIPHGFYEDEMNSYFSQFGRVLAVLVARSKNSGRSKGFGFVQFADEEVAKIAAETMNNYLMCNRIIKCEYIPPEKSKKKSLFSRITPWDYPKKKNRIIDATKKLEAVKKLTKATYRKKADMKINTFKKIIEEKSQK